MGERMSKERFEQCRSHFDAGFPDWDSGDSAPYFTEVWNAFVAEREETERLQAEVERLETDVGAAAWIAEWMVADQFRKPSVPVWLHKARIRYRDTVKRADRLQAEVERLRKDNEEWQQGGMDNRDWAKNAEAEMWEAEAEMWEAKNRADRLQAALDEIAERPGEWKTRVSIGAVGEFMRGQDSAYHKAANEIDQIISDLKAAESVEKAS